MVMAKPSGEQDGGPGGKRPAPTIEGTATEVVEESSAAQATDAEQAAPKDPKDEAEDEAEPKAGFDGEKIESEVRRGATLPELKGFVTHLAAGLLGGLVGVVGLAFFWDRLPADGSEEAAPEIAALEARVGKLEAVPPPDTDAAAIKALDQRIETLNASAAKASAEVSDLSNRVAHLEKSLGTLAKTASQGGSVADAAAVAARMAEAEQRMQTGINAALAEAEQRTRTGINAALAQRDAATAAAINTARGELADLKARVETLAEAAPIDADYELDLDSLDARIAKLEAALADVAAQGATGTKSAAAAITFANLRAAVSEGRPYATELVAVETVLPDQDDLMALAAHAETGIPTAAQLTRSFQAAKEASLAAASGPVDDSFVGNLLASAKSAVKIRRIDAAPTGDDARAMLARAETELKQGALAEAVKEVETLSGPPRQAMEPWLNQARARIAADATLRNMETALLKSMIGADGEQE